MKEIDILMVEDNPGDVVLVKEAMKKASLSFRMQIVSDGVEALEFLLKKGRYASACNPDLIILDLKLPRKNGREVLSELHEYPVFQKIPLVVISSSRSELELARRYHKPNQIYLTKPSTFKEYIALVKSMDAFRQDFSATCEKSA
jgi:two-component system, chemotaxis family, response regulator Rcp1